MTATSTTRIDASTVATTPLDEKDPFTQLDGSPLGTRSRTTWTNIDGRIETGIWECDAGRFHADFGGYGELMTIISGEVECIGDDGSHFTLRTGDSMTFPRGWTGEWIMPRPLRKVFALWQVD